MTKFGNMPAPYRTPDSYIGGTPDWVLWMNREFNSGGYQASNSGGGTFTIGSSAPPSDSDLDTVLQTVVTSTAPNPTTTQPTTTTTAQPTTTTTQAPTAPQAVADNKIVFLIKNNPIAALGIAGVIAYLVAGKK